KAEKPKKIESAEKKPKHEKKQEPFNPLRFPTFLKLNAVEKNGVKAISLPQGAEKTISLNTDVENHYFDRIDEPGELKIALLSKKTSETKGGTEPGNDVEIEQVLNVHKASPKDGQI